MQRDYEKFYEKFMDYELKLHEKNQRKIKTGFKVNILLPLVFLFLCFLIPGTRFLFLMLWIISLFGIAFYLVYVEYTDYKMMDKMKEFGAEYDEDRNLRGDSVEKMEQKIDDKMDEIEERIDFERQRLEKELERLNSQRDTIEKERRQKLAGLGERIKGKSSEKKQENEE